MKVWSFKTSITKKWLKKVCTVFWSISVFSRWDSYCQGSTDLFFVLQSFKKTSEKKITGMNRSELRFNDYIVLIKLKKNNLTMKFNAGNNNRCHLVPLASSTFGRTGKVSLACISSMCLVQHSVPLCLFSLSFGSCVYFFFPLISWCDGCLVLLKWGIQGVGVLGLMFAGYVPLASQSPTPL